MGDVKGEGEWKWGMRRGGRGRGSNKIGESSGGKFIREEWKRNTDAKAQRNERGVDIGRSLEKKCMGRGKVFSLEIEYQKSGLNRKACSRGERMENESFSF